MSTLLALLLVAILLFTEHLRRKKEEVPVFARRYFHPGHTWMRPTEDGEVVVGIDEIAAGIMGGIEAVAMPRYFGKMRQGQPSFTLTRAGRSITFVSPVTGRVIEKNEMIIRNPSLILSSPLCDGWVLKIHPSHLPSEIRNLFTGKWAEYWNELTRSYLLRFFSPAPIGAAQDGGSLMNDLALRCSDNEWRELARELFMSNGDVLRLQDTRQGNNNKEGRQ